MTRQEHLLIRAMEECNEVSQRLSKALIFGLEQVQQHADDKPEQNPELLTNRERVLREYEELAGVMEMSGFTVLDRRRIDAKKFRVERYLELSRVWGTLRDEGK